MALADSTKARYQAGFSFIIHMISLSGLWIGSLEHARITRESRVGAFDVVAVIERPPVRVEYVPVSVATI